MAAARSPGSGECRAAQSRASGDRQESRHAGLPLTSQAATEAWASRLAAIVRAGDVIALRGDLGAGKTVFARALVRARGRPDEEVPSPTFTLVQTYDGADSAAPAVWHFDLFRLDSPEDALELGIEDAFAEAVSLIEWPDRLGDLLPPSRLDLTLAPGALPDARALRIEAGADWWCRLREAGLV